MYITICHNSRHSLTHQAGKGLQHVREHLVKQTYKVYTFKVFQQHAAWNLFVGCFPPHVGG